MLSRSWLNKDLSEPGIGILNAEIFGVFIRLFEFSHILTLFHYVLMPFIRAFRLILQLSHGIFQRFVDEIGLVPPTSEISAKLGGFLG